MRFLKISILKLFVLAFFLVIPPAFSLDKYPLGLAVKGGLYQGEEFSSYLDDLQVKRMKTCFYWGDIEPEPGRYNWQAFDKYISQIKPQDRALVCVFTNGWCTNNESHKGATLKNQECYQAYYNFIAKMVRRAQGKVLYWQRDTEPASRGHFPQNKAKEYVEIQKVFYRAVKASQPTAIVLGSNHNGDLRRGELENYEFFEYFLENARDYFDVLDLRLYGDLYTIEKRINWFKEAMRRYGYQKPIMVTEFGGPDPRQLSGNVFFKFLKSLQQGKMPPQRRRFFKRRRVLYAPASLVAYGPQDRFKRRMEMRNQRVQENLDKAPLKLRLFLEEKDASLGSTFCNMQCSDIIQRHIIAYSLGIEASWQWVLVSAGKDLIFGKMRLITPEGKKLPRYFCFRRLIKKLKGFKKVEKVPAEAGIYLYKVSYKNKKPLYVAWHRERGQDSYEAETAMPILAVLPLNFKKAVIFDIYGKKKEISFKQKPFQIELSGRPVYIEGASD